MIKLAGMTNALMVSAEQLRDRVMGRSTPATVEAIRAPVLKVDTGPVVLNSDASVRSVLDYLGSRFRPAPEAFRRGDEPWIRVNQDVLKELVAWQDLFTPTFLRERLKDIGFDDPGLQIVDIQAGVARESVKVLEIPAAQLQALLDFRALQGRTKSLGAPAGFEFLRMRDGELEYRLPVEAALGMRGVRRRIKEADSDAQDGGSVTPERVLAASARRIAERSGLVPQVALETIDGRTCLVMPPSQGAVLIAPASPRSAEARVRAEKAAFDPDASGFSKVNNVFFAQLAKLVYAVDADEKPLMSAEVEKIAEAIGLQQPRLIQEQDAEVLAGVVPAVQRPDGTSSKAQLVLVARGTTDAKDWLRNLNVLPESVGPPGRVHAGFSSYWRAVEPSIEAYWAETRQKLGLKNADVEGSLAGHSLGGAAALLGATRVLLARASNHGGERAASLPLKHLYTFGQPRGVDGKLANWIRDEVKASGATYSALTDNFDLVTSLPVGPTWKDVPEVRRYYGADGELLDEGLVPQGFYTAQERIEMHDMGLYLAMARKDLDSTR